MVRAIAAAGAWCDIPANRGELASLLSGKDYLRLPPEILRPALCGPFNFGQGRIEQTPDFLIYHAGQAHVPTEARALSVQRDLAATGLIAVQQAPELPRQLFREDLHHLALESSMSTAKHGR